MSEHFGEADVFQSDVTKKHPTEGKSSIGLIIDVIMSAKKKCLNPTYPKGDINMFRIVKSNSFLAT